MVAVTAAEFRKSHHAETVAVTVTSKETTEINNR